VAAHGPARPRSAGRRARDRADARFLRHLLTAYGYPPDRLDRELQRRLLAYTLLHRYSDLAWYLEELPAPPVATLDALAAHWWSLG
jgi:hygromycin-B 7''-O-kinase